MDRTDTWREKAKLWIRGYNPSQDGWTLLGPADSDNALAWASDCRDRGIEVARFISPLGKLCLYARASRDQVFQHRATSGASAGSRPPVDRGAEAPA